MINLRDNSLGTSFIDLTYFKFARGDENPLKLVRNLKYYDHDCLRKQFFVISALSTLLRAKWLRRGTKKKHFPKVFLSPGYFLFRFQA